MTIAQSPAQQIDVEPIPLVDLKAQYALIREDVDRAMREVVESSAFIMGPQIARFEAAFAAFSGARHCVGVSSGTSALELSLRVLGVGQGDEVITVAHTFIATAEAISAVGATPVFVDVDPITYCMDPSQIEAKISPRTRALIPVHLYGQIAPMEDICAIAEQHGLAVIEDAAQAHGARRHGNPVGHGSKMACYSFYPGKNLGAFGDAGAVVTDDEGLAAEVSLLRNHGRRSKYEHEVIGFGDRMDTLQAAVLLAKLAYLGEWTTTKQALAARYTRDLADLPITLPALAPGNESAWHLYVVLSEKRDALGAFLQGQGIQSGVHYPLPLHLQPAYAHLGYGRGALPVTEQASSTCLSLPIYPEMTPTQQDRIIAAVRQFFGAEVESRTD